MTQAHPDWNPLPWGRRLRAWFDGSYKLIQASPGDVERYDLAADPDELHDLSENGS